VEKTDRAETFVYLFDKTQFAKKFITNAPQLMTPKHEYSPPMKSVLSTYQSYKRQRYSTEQLISNGKMVVRFKRNLDIIGQLYKPDHNTILKHSYREIIICKIIDNILYGNVPITPLQKKKLLQYKSILRYMASKKACLAEKKKQTFFSVKLVLSTYRNYKRRRYSTEQLISNVKLEKW
jgi:hypothetical protein